jgi:outer membrane immunogenic protein
VTAFGGGFTQTQDLSSKVDWLSLNSVRVGFVAADRWMIYGKGGVALARETHRLGIEQVVPGLGSATLDVSGRALHTGLLAGVGAEYAFLGNWSAKLEYNYLNFGPQDVMATGVQAINIPPVQVGSIANLQRLSNIREERHLVKFGVNYHFNAIPAVLSARF